MTSQELADQFFTIACEIKTKCLTNLSKEQLSRGVYSRLYYAMYHKYLAHDSTLQETSFGKKHEIIQTNIARGNYDPKTKQLYKKMYALRLWADYNTRVAKDILEADMDRYVYDASKIISQAKLVS